MPIFLAAVADDDTGATDLAGMLAEQGMRPVLLLDANDAEQIESRAGDCDAIIVGTASRSVARNEAYARTSEALKAMLALRPQTVLVKYCSTFDSTAEGNIGASIDAAMDVLNEPFTVAMPALPALSRTTYMGYHFVGDKLLSDSVLREHPLNPMTNSHLRSHLATQTKRRIGNVLYPDVRRGARQIGAALETEKARGTEIALLDCLNDEQLSEIGKATAGMRLITGSSAWGTVLPKIWRESGRWWPAAGPSLTRAPRGSGVLVVSGSCSKATRAQNAWAANNGFRVFPLDLLNALSDAGQGQPDLAASIAAALDANECCLLTTISEQDSERLARKYATENHLTALETGERFSAGLARTVGLIFSRQPPAFLIVSGGETSSVLMRALDLRGLRVGLNIEPGVPVCVSFARPELGVVLKSGNFGSENFYSRAVASLRALPTRE